MNLKLRSEDLEWRHLDDEIVVLDGREGTYLSINGSGALLWPSLATGATSEELIGTLVKTYEVDESQARADTEQFVASLRAQGLLVG
jgi:hypothetical protein